MTETSKPDNNAPGFAWAIRTQLTVLFLILLVPLIIYLSIDLKSHLDREINNASTMSQILSRLISTEVSDYLATRKNILARIAERKQIQAMDPENCDPVIMDFPEFDKNFSNIIVLNRDGEVTCSAIPFKSKMSFKKSENFNRVLNEKELVVGYPIYGKISNKWVLPLNYPVRDNSNNIIGTIGAPIDLLKYSPVNRDFNLPFNALVLIIEQTGIVVSSSRNPDKWVGSNIIRHPEYSSISELLKTEAFDVNLSTDQLLISMSRIRNTNWKLLISLPRGLIEQAAYSIAKREFIMYAALLSIILFLGIVFIRRVEEPIKEMANTATTVANGKLDARLNPKGPKEIRDLARQFNYMLTRREETDNKNREYAEHLGLAMESARIATWRFDIENQHFSHSKNLGVLLGLTENTKFNSFDDLHDLIFTDDKSRFMNVVTESLHEYNDIDIDDVKVLWSDSTFHNISISGKFIDANNPSRAHLTGIIMDVTDRVKSMEKMQFLATHDPMTNLVNRIEFKNRVQHALRGARYQNNQHAILYIDLDQFKIVNDTCGHHAGDELLTSVANILLEKVRKTDTVSRLGGDEFGILLENCPLNEAIKMSEALRKSIESFRFSWKDKVFKISSSIGLVLIKDNQAEYDVLMSQADAACFIAKDKGRNCIHVYTEDEDLESRHMHDMEFVSTINEALEQSRFCLYYQKIIPVSETSTQALDKLLPMGEVLLRLKDKDGHILPPMAFIPAAERYGLMNNIDEYVITQLTDHIKQDLNQSGKLSVRLFCVNISAASLSDIILMERVRKLLQNNTNVARRLCFEITETSAISNINQARRFIDEFKQLGCKFALDDFGTGMSSFAYLKNLNIDFLKIDGSFITDIMKNPVNTAILESISHVAHMMGIKTIAEWVEDEAVIEKLETIGFDFAQGHAIAEAAPLEEISTGSGNIHYLSDRQM